MRRFLIGLAVGVTVSGWAIADMPPRYPWQKRIDPRDQVPREPPPRTGLCSWLPIAGMTAAPLAFGYWYVRRNQRGHR
jgi:hypothetical protein